MFNSGLSIVNSVLLALTALAIVATPSYGVELSIGSRLSATEDRVYAGCARPPRSKCRGYR